MSQPFEYFAYGLHIRAAFALWPWGHFEDTSTAATQVNVTLAESSAVFEPHDFRPGLAHAVLDWPGVGSFSIARGKQIFVRPARGVAIEELALVTAGPVLALLLEQRGCLVLHGSCVDIDGQGTALLGTSGVGKSTIAATLRDHGYPLISDGMTVVDVSGGEPHALPGPPHLKLWPDAVESLAGSGAGVDTCPVARQKEKLWYQASGFRAVSPTPLRQVFLLEPGTDVSSRRLGPAAGLIGLVKNYFLADFADNASQEFILQRCSLLGGRIPVSTLQRGQALTDLPAVVAELRGRRMSV